MDGEARHVSTCNKAVYQDYTAVAHYLTQEQWRFFLKETECDENKAMRIGEVMSLLGCQVAGETTLAFVTALLYSLPGCKFAHNGPQDLHNSYIFTKKYGRHVMAAAPSMIMDVPIIERLPLRWQ